MRFGCTEFGIKAIGEAVPYKHKKRQSSEEIVFFCVAG